MTKAGCHCDKMPDKNCFALFKYFITVMRKVTNTDTSHPNTLTESSCAFPLIVHSFSVSLSSVYVHACARSRVPVCHWQLTRGCSVLLPCGLCESISSRQASWKCLPAEQSCSCDTNFLGRVYFSHNVCWSLAFWLLWRSNTLWWGVQGTHLVTF